MGWRRGGGGGELWWRKEGGGGMGLAKVSYCDPGLERGGAVMSLAYVMKQ